MPCFLIQLARVTGELPVGVTPRQHDMSAALGPSDSVSQLPQGSFQAKVVQLRLVDGINEEPARLIGGAPRIQALTIGDLQFYGNEAIQPAVEEQQVKRKVAASDLERELRPDEAEVASEFDQELAQLGEQARMQVGFGVRLGQIQEVEHVGVLEGAYGLGPTLYHH